TITQPSAVTLSASSIPACGSFNGTATAIAGGGTGPYTYSWAPAGGSTSSASGLGSGTYTCVVTDANGCTQVTSVAVVTNTFPVADAGSDVTISQGNN